MILLGEALKSVFATLDGVGLLFLVGGSIASGIHGHPRQTNGVDILVLFAEGQLEEFLAVLEPEFYVDRQEAVDAVRRNRAFNAIHRRSALKFDIFPAKDAFTQSELARRRWSKAPLPGLEDLEFPVASAEDMVLAKLVWFRTGGEVSDRQWHDILGILNVQRAKLDQGYLSEWSRQLGVDDLLAKAKEEA